MPRKRVQILGQRSKGSGRGELQTTLKLLYEKSRCEREVDGGVVVERRRDENCGSLNLGVPFKRTLEGVEV